MKPQDATYVAESIRTQISVEEMLHMGLTCNLLISLGEPPVLNKPEGLPTYPDHLPGNVNPNLIISLQELSKKSLLDFLKIEQPQFPPLASPEFMFGFTELQEQDNSFPTISDFYDYILATFKRLNLTLQTDKQIDFFDRFNIHIPASVPKDFSSTILKTLQDVESAIQIIKKQGEGSTISPADDGTTKLRDDLAHYYRFAEIYKGKKLILVDDQWKFGDEDIPFPEVYPMAEVPLGGYIPDKIKDDEKGKKAKVEAALKEFDTKFSEMMDQLQEAWSVNPTELVTAIFKTMFSLQESAQILISTPIAEDTSQGNYGPCFRYLQPDQR